MPPEEEEVEPLDLESVIGADVEVQFNGETWTDWEKVSLKPTIGKHVKNPGDAKREHKRLGRRDCTGTLSYILGGKRIPGLIPGPGTEVTGLKFNIGGVNLIPANLDDPAVYGKCYVMSMPFEIGDGQGSIGIDIEWCFDEPDAVVEGGG